LDIQLKAPPGKMRVVAVGMVGHHDSERLVKDADTADEAFRVARVSHPGEINYVYDDHGMSQEIP
jgi:hypothetical protein